MYVRVSALLTSSDIEVRYGKITFFENWAMTFDKPARAAACSVVVCICESGIAEKVSRGKVEIQI